MLHFPIESAINDEHGVRSVPKVHAYFYLNRYPFNVVESDGIIDSLDGIPYTRGLENIMPVESLSETYRFGHGATNAILGTSINVITDYKIPARVPQERLYLSGEDCSYKYYITYRASTSGAAGVNGDYYAITGDEETPLGTPTIEYFDEHDNPSGLYANAAVLKWNTTTTIPKRYKVSLKCRAVDTFDEYVWTEVYDSQVDDYAHLATAERYGVASVVNTDGETTRIQFAKYDTIFRPAVGDWDGRPIRRRVPWTSDDYLDPIIGSYVAIMNVDNSINGIQKVKNLSREDGWIEVYGSTLLDRSINSQNPAVEVYVVNAGETMLYRQEDGSWSPRQNLYTESNNNLLDVAGIKVDILSVNNRNARAEMIELGPVLAADLSDSILDLSTKEEASERSVSQPVGQMSANSGSLTLSNSTRMFDIQNTRRKTVDGWVGSFLAGLLLDGVEIKSYQEVVSLVDGVSSLVPLTPLITDVWEPSDNNKDVSVNLMDYSSILQNRSCPDLLLKDHPITSIVYMMLDKCGFSRVLGWPESDSPLDTEQTLPWFWCRKEETIWDALQRLAASVQTAIFFDRYGYLRILPLNVFANKERGEVGKNVWKMRAVDTDEGLSNIYNISRLPITSVNKVTVNYKTTSIHGEAGVLARDTFWLPPDGYNMRVGTLTENILPSSTTISTVSDGKRPPFDRLHGAVFVGNEVIEYDATEVSLLSATGGAQNRWIKNETERKRAVLDNDGQEVVFTGRLRIKPDQPAFIGREMAGEFSGLNFADVSMFDPWSTPPSSQRVSVDTANRGIAVNTNTVSSGLTVIGLRDMAEPYSNIITKFKITKGKIYNADGIWQSRFGITLFPQRIGGALCYYEIQVLLGDDLKKKKHVEATIRIRRRNPNGTYTTIPQILMKSHMGLDVGTPVNLNEWVWLEVKVADNNAFTIEFNGNFAGYFKDKIIDNGGPLPRSNQFGINAKDGSAVFSRVLAIGRSSRVASPPNLGFLEAWKFNNGKGPDKYVYYSSKYEGPDWTPKKGWTGWAREWDNTMTIYADSIYDSLFKSARKYRDGNIFIAEMSDSIQEYIIENIRFENGPAVASEFINMNKEVSLDFLYTSPFGARFELRNNSYVQQMLSGEFEDPQTEVKYTQYMAIVGNKIVQEDAQAVVKLKDLIQRSGEKSIEIDAEWIQTYSQAQQIGRWILENQGSNVEVYGLHIYANPLIEIGDHVDIEYSERGLLPTKQRFVVESISTSKSKSEIIVRKIYPGVTSINSASLTWD